MIGISAESISTYKLSIPKPASADSKCSTVDTLMLSGFIKQVHKVVSPTASGAALISTTGSRSIRRKTIPVFIGAGRRVTCTFSPLCSPTPTVETLSFNVRCLII